MNRRHSRTIAFLIGAAILLPSCAHRLKSARIAPELLMPNSYSDDTGATGPAAVWVDGGRFTMGVTEEDLVPPGPDAPHTVCVDGFYLEETEVTNLRYRAYTDWVGRTEGARSYAESLPDTTCWRRALSYNESFVEHYFRHPAFGFYPVVGISWNQANEYIRWRNARAVERVAAHQGKRNHRSLQPVYRLPSEAEWEYAALGLRPEPPTKRRRGEEHISNTRYPWEKRSIYTSSGSDVIMDFARNDETAYSFTPAPAYSGIPKGHYLYGMEGNVSEWTSDTFYPADIPKSPISEDTLAGKRPKVFKGGSWADRAYWMIPGTRRFLDANEGSATIGFRCAMTLQRL